jgi:tetratricopeptide (TPR) repeat protein
MPSHIFAGLGMWDDTIASNKDSFDASDRAVRKLGQPLYLRSYHAVLYWLYALLQQAKEAEARALLAEHRPVLEGGDGAAKRNLHDLLARFYVDTDHPAEAAEMPILVERPLQKAEALFLRGLGQARTGKLDAADTSLRDMRVIVAQIVAAKDLDVAVRARVLDVQAKQLEATLLLARKQNDAALKRLEETVRIEDAPGVSLAPPDAGTGIPAHEFLGEVLLQLGRRAEAAREFETALKKTPGRRRSVEGLVRAKAAASRSR